MKEATLNAKVAIVDEIKDLIGKSQSVVFVDYRGLTVSEVTELRNKMREANVVYKVLKNTYIKRAADDLGIGGVAEYLEGPTAVAFGVEDAVAPAKILADFIKATKKTELKGGILEGKVCDVNTIKALSEIPSREELLAKMLGSLNAPITNFVRVLDALAKKRAEEGDAPAAQEAAPAADAE